MEQIVIARKKIIEAALLLAAANEPERSTAAIEQPTLLQPRSTGLWLLPWFVPPRY